MIRENVLNGCEITKYLSKAIKAIVVNEINPNIEPANPYNSQALEMKKYIHLIPINCQCINTSKIPNNIICNFFSLLNKNNIVL